MQIKKSSITLHSNNGLRWRDTFKSYRCYQIPLYKASNEIRINESTNLPFLECIFFVTFLTQSPPPLKMAIVIKDIVEMTNFQVPGSEKWLLKSQRTQTKQLNTIIRHNAYRVGRLLSDWRTVRNSWLQLERQSTHTTENELCAQAAFLIVFFFFTSAWVCYVQL